MKYLITILFCLANFACGDQMADRSDRQQADEPSDPVKSPIETKSSDAVPGDDKKSGGSEGAGDNEGATEGEEQSDDGESSEKTYAAFSCPKYPLVFHHGFMSGGKAGGFRGIKEMFSKKGCAYLETEVAAVQTATYRAGQLKTQVEAFLKKTGAAKVNIVAHSQGGLDARYMISKLGLAGQVASLSTIGTPHRGTAVADTAMESTGPLAKKALSAMLNLMGRTINSNTQDPDTMAAVESLTEKNMVAFNADVPDAAGVYYQSWGGQSGAGTKDALKALLVISHTMLSGKSGANDGVVAVSSAKWGEYRGTLDADHLDQIGYKLLDFKSPFQAADFYGQLAGELATNGY
jgi:triacylglycerol lipase